MSCYTDRLLWWTLKGYQTIADSNASELASYLLQMYRDIINGVCESTANVAPVN